MLCSCTLSGTTACLSCSNYKSMSELIKMIPNKSTEKPVFKKIKKLIPEVQYWCPECSALLNKYDKFCHNCGIGELNWDIDH